MKKRLMSLTLLAVILAALVTGCAPRHNMPPPPPTPPGAPAP